jgi:hypothetical protein
MKRIQTDIQVLDYSNYIVFLQDFANFKTFSKAENRSENV